MVSNIKKEQNNFLSNEFSYLPKKLKEELHLIVLWENARYKEKEILDDISKCLEIREVIEIEWDEEYVANNFTRFYGVKLPNNSHKEKECGKGKFLLITVIDKNPVYNFEETSRGYEYLNTNIFTLKQKYRSWTNNGHKVHTTNNPKETNHDIVLLLGKNYEDYIKNAPISWDGKIKTIKRNLTGFNGWKSLEELFYVLNAATNYVVLRNSDILPQNFQTDLHGDIDLLVDDYLQTQFITGSISVFDENYRVHNKVKVNNQFVFFDFRYLEDNYYCYNFEKDLLENKIRNNNNINVLDCYYQFYSLIYHCLIHKSKIALDYFQKMYALFIENHFEEKYNLSEYKYTFDLYYQMLNDFMKSNNYSYVEPVDKSVYYNKKVIDLKKNIDILQNDYFISAVQPYMVNHYGLVSEYVFYTGVINNKKVFIKWGGVGESSFNEFQNLLKLNAKNNKNFLKPYFYKYDNNEKFIVMDFVEGQTLDVLLQNNSLTDENKEYIKNELENIAKTLIECNIIHRDIRPENIMVTDDSKVILIDTQFATDYMDELDIIKSEPQKFAGLGANFAPMSYVWDDMFSLSKVLTLIDKKSDFIDSNIGKNIKKLDRKYITKTTFLQQVFSVKNGYFGLNKYKVITILGIKIKIKV